ncbi:hypothetical protein NM208_g3964 [Fusarium decemcellulare]|uniref:Uncharacterized protein n=1 Tax=Fusarium decemcellulare TaxID=57161 RepID=A0ACC1SMP1_9HYPO|nr:hypothetical protein NM208_g3964 [Fusarium decemcellulare]
MSVRTIKASVLHGARDLREENRTIPPPGADELQVSVRATGICGSDQHYYKHFRNGDILIREPMSLGHESSGVVEAVGPGVTGFDIGDRVALEVGLSCGSCKLCKAGKYNLCRNMQFRGSAKHFPHFQGTLQERINHPARLCHKLPDGVTDIEGALVEPLSVAINAIRRAALKADEKALVLGAGPVGLLVAAMLRVEKIDDITIADIEKQRVDFAILNGFASRGVVMPKTAPGSNASEDKMSRAKEAARLLTDGDEFDVVFECTGVEACVQSAIYSTAPSGRVMIIGMGTPVQTLPLSAASLREVDILGVFRYANTYSYGIDLLARRDAVRLPDISKLVTHKFSDFQEVPLAFDAAARTKDDDGNLVLKVIIET